MPRTSVEAVRTGPAPGDVIDEASRELAHERLEETDHARREALVHELPEALVAGVVHAHDRHERVRLGQNALGRGEDLGRLRDVHHVVVARQDPEPALGVPVDRSVLAKPPIVGSRVAA